MSPLFAEELCKKVDDLFYDNILAEKIFHDPLYRDIISSSPFQRLKDIRFLGAIDYVFRPNGQATSRRHTRYQHSLGVAALALQYAKIMGLGEHAEKRIVSSALLHDIGHAPLSHSLEPAFKTFSGIGHHEAGMEIIMGTSPLGRQIKDALDAHRVDPASINTLLDKNAISLGANKFEAIIFCGAINIDTIEAITRSYSYMSRRGMIVKKEDILLSFIRRNKSDMDVLDYFWNVKNSVYSNLINSSSGFLADATAIECFKKHSKRIEQMDFFLTESQLKKKIPLIFRRLIEIFPANRQLSFWKLKSARRVVRNFFIDIEHPLNDHENDHKRYRHSKTTVRVHPVDVSLIRRHGDQLELKL